MKRSFIPGFIKRKSLTYTHNEAEIIFPEADQSHLGAASSDEIKFLAEKCEFVFINERTNTEKENDDSNEKQDLLKLKTVNDASDRQKRESRHSIFEGIFLRNEIDESLGQASLSCIAVDDQQNTYIDMLDQEDIIALTSRVKRLSDALNNLRNTFKDSFVDGKYNASQCETCARNRLSDVCKILQGILNENPFLRSPDILSAASNIIVMIKEYDYTDGVEGPADFQAEINQLALSFSRRVSDFEMGDKEMTSSSINQYEDSFGDIDGDDDFDAKSYPVEEYDDESEDSLDKTANLYNVKQQNHEEISSGNYDNIPSSPVVPDLQAKELNNQMTDELDKTLRSIEGSVDIALQRTKVWSKYAKDILSYLEKKSAIGADFSRQLTKLAQQTRHGIIEGSYMPFQSIFVTALDSDVQFANQCSIYSQGQLQNIIDRLSQRQKEHDIERSKIKNRWKAEVKKLHDSRDNLKQAKKNYMQKQKEFEKFSKQMEGKDEKGGFSIGKKKHPEEILRTAEESEDHYRQCVVEANYRQHELERIKQDVLIELRQLIYQCDLTMKSVTISYFQLMNRLLSPLPIQFRTLEESSSSYVEGQQFAEFVRLQQSTCNQAMFPTYHFEKYRGEGEKFNSLIKHGEITAISHISSESTLSPAGNPPRRNSFNDLDQRSVSPNLKKNRPAWGKHKGSATDDTDSISSRSLPPSPGGSPIAHHKIYKPLNIGAESDEEPELKGLKAPKLNKNSGGGFFKNLQNVSEAAKMHKFRNVRSPSKCKECDSYVYFNGAECEKCGIICHKKCLEKLNIKCGNKRLPRKMTTFGVDFHHHLASTKRKDIPYIIEKCINEIDENGLTVKGLYRVSGVKSKVEKLCQQFETGGDLVDLSNTPPHFVASVLKLYLRQLPEPLLTFKQYQEFIDVGRDSMNLKLAPKDIENLSESDASHYESIIEWIHAVVKNLPPPNFFTTAKLIRHLKRVSEHSDMNQMSAANLAIVFGPTLLRPEGNPSSLASVMDMPHQTRAVELLILNCHIFSVNKDGEIDIETMTGEKPSMNNSRIYKKKKKQADVISETSPVAPAEHQRDDSNISVGAEFSQELFDMMETTTPNHNSPLQKSLASSKADEKEETVAASDVPTPKEIISGPSSPSSLPIALEGNKSPVVKKLNQDYDNVEPEGELDNVHTDLPSFPKLSTRTSNQSAVSTISEDADTQSQLSSVESLLSGDGSAPSFGSSSPVELPDSLHEDDDDAWMNQFEKDRLVKTRSMSSSDVKEILSDKSISSYSRKKKNSSLSRLETTSYSFSIGGRGSDESKRNTEREKDEVNFELKIGSGDIDSSVWVKRDSKQRVPVRKLKPICIKSSTIISSVPNNRQKSPDLSPSPFSLDDKKINDIVGDHVDSVSFNDGTVKPRSLSSDSRVSREEDPGSPTRVGPSVLPKPKKPLDKKSWTADLIKSKSQPIPEQPQPGSLNDKLMQKRKTDDTKSEEVQVTRNVPLSNTSIKEIRTKFQPTPSFLKDGKLSTTLVKDDKEKKSNEEKYV